MTNRNPPSKELCLRMAERFHEQRDDRLMWVWLITWGFYEMYLEGWVTG